MVENSRRFAQRLAPDRLSDNSQSALVFLLYSVASLLFFGRGLLGHLTTSHIGEGADPELMMWCLAWWPHALIHLLNPFFTDVIWSPSGFNITWVTSIPLPSLVAAPLTAVLGPIATLNILCLIALPLAAWSAFLLCRHLSKHFWGSVLGGYIFGFCPTLLGQLLFGRLHSIFVFPVPLAVLLVIRRLRDEIGSCRFSTLLALCLATVFLCSPEIFATATVFGSMVLFIAWAMSDERLRAALVRTTVSSFYAYLMALPLISPYLIYMLASRRPYDGPLWNNNLLSADLLNFVIPTPTNEVGSFKLFEKLSGPFNIGLPAEAVAFLSWPLIVLAWLFARKYWRELRGRLLVDALVIIVTCSLGPALIVRGNALPIGLPWAGLDWWVLNNAAPARFCMYAFLVFAVMAALWLSSAQLKIYQKAIFSLAVLVGLLPNVSSSYWVYSAEAPAFFHDGLYRNYLEKGESVLVLPFWPRNQAMLWQAQSGMYFKMAGGPGPWPVQVAAWPILDAFMRETYIPNAAEQLELFLVQQGVSAVVMDEASFSSYGKLMGEIGVPPIRVGGVYLYRLMRISPAEKLTMMQARVRSDEARFDDLLVGVQKYLTSGGAADKLSAPNILPLGLISARSVIGEPAPPEIRDSGDNWWRTSHVRYGLLLFVNSDHTIVIGEVASGAGADRIIEKYRGIAAETDFVTFKWARGFVGEKRERAIGIVAISFDRQRLAQQPRKPSPL